MMMEAVSRSSTGNLEFSARTCDIVLSSSKKHTAEHLVVHDEGHHGGEELQDQRQLQPWLSEILFRTDLKIKNKL